MSELLSVGSGLFYGYLTFFGELVGIVEDARLEKSGSLAQSTWVAAEADV